MTDWINNAEGIRFDGNMEFTYDNIKDYDFIVDEIGKDGGVILHKNIQHAKDFNKPIFVIVPFMLDDNILEFGPDYLNWKVENFPFCKLVKEKLYNKQIAGIIIDTRSIMRPNGKPFTTWWICKYTNAIMKYVYDVLKVDAFMIMNKAPYELADANGKEMLIDLLDKWGVSVANTGENPILPYDDTSLVVFDFWFYDFSSKVNWKVRYNGTKEELYNILGFIDNASYEGILVGEPSEEIIEIINLLNTIVFQLEEIKLTNRKINDIIDKVST